jgi:hypothetical protein
MRNNDRNYLFSNGDLYSTLENNKRAAVSAVASITRDRFLATSVDTLIEHVVSEHTIEPLVIYEDQMRMDQHETRIDVTGRFEYGFGGSGRSFAAGHQLNFYLPFTGDVNLWNLKPNTWSSVTPQGKIDANNSRLIISLADTVHAEPERYKQELGAEMTRIRQSLQSQTGMIAEYHNELPNLVRTAVLRRREELEKLNGLVAFFDIPLAAKPGMPEFRPIEVKKRVPRPLPLIARTDYKPEPGIADETYEQILSTIRHAGASFEGTPQTYLSLGEEGLRDNVVSHLNAFFEGKATGETFRKYGKTDIRIEEETRSAFVGECKLWGGEKVLVGALNQLLDYLTWRDCKAALVIFNKEVGGFSGVQKTISEVLPMHSNFLREKHVSYSGEWRYVFKSAEDPSREVTVHVFAFNLYVSPARASKKR